MIGRRFGQLRRNSLKFFPVIVALVVTLPIWSEAQPPSQAFRCQSGQIESMLDDLRLIREAPQKPGEPFVDPHAAAILSIGKPVAPCLVAKLTDASPSRVIDLFHYAVGDVALVLLVALYQPPTWPSPDGSVVLETTYGDYRDYLALVESADGRERLRKSWDDYVQVER